MVACELVIVETNNLVIKTDRNVLTSPMVMIRKTYFSLITSSYKCSVTKC